MTLFRKMLIRFVADDWTEGYALHLGFRGAHDELSIAKSILFEPKNEPVYSEPCMKFTPEEAQQLMDALFEAGVRPSEIGYPGQLAAVRYHLEDMRRLVFKEKKP